MEKRKIIAYTANEGIEIQTVQLLKWKKLLKPKVFEDLKKWATENNWNKNSGYDVVKGSMFYDFLSNYHNKNYTPKN